MELLVILSFHRQYVPTSQACVSFTQDEAGLRMLQVTGSIMFSVKLLSVAEIVGVAFHIGNYLICLLCVYVSREQIPSSCRG